MEKACTVRMPRYFLPQKLRDTFLIASAFRQGVKDPEKKRKLIGSEFIDVFREFRSELEKKLGHRPKYLVQVFVSLTVQRSDDAILLLGYQQF
eukprot:scaffold246875_cov50-Prasinocladus_malaysianus.AAC.3